MIDYLDVASHDLRFSASWGRRFPIVFVAIAALYLPVAVSAQTNTFPASGNVGIGTTNPQFPLDVNGEIRIPVNTNLSFGTPDFGSGQGGWISYNSSGGYLVIEAIHQGVSFLPVVLNPTAGNVGIGTTNPQHLLHVAGTIGAEEVIVTATGADYVFQPGYHLSPLNDVSAYIKENHHLPDIPSAAEMQAKGLNVGDLQVKLLAKVEELTLHMIQVDQENRELKDRIKRLEAATDESTSRAK